MRSEPVVTDAVLTGPLVTGPLVTGPVMTDAVATGPVAETLARELAASRERSLAYTEADDDELVRQHSPLMSPLVWDLAHVGNYEELWLLRALTGASELRPGIDSLYDAFRHPRASRTSLPLLTPAQARRYVAEVRTSRRAERQPLSRLAGQRRHLRDLPPNFVIVPARPGPSGHAIRRVLAGGTRTRGANLDRVNDQSQIEDMRAAVRGDRERAEQARQRSQENVRALLTEPDPEPAREPDPEPDPEPRRSFLSRLLGR